MKYFVFFTMLILVSYLLGFVNKLKSFGWMDRAFTTSVKGFSILTVIWAHSGAIFGIEGIQFIAGIGVALFLICSGYGLEVSYTKNGLKCFWKKRLLGVFLTFWCVEFVGLLISKQFEMKKYILDALFINPATSYGWFMQYIVICYFLFFVVKLISEKTELNGMKLFFILFGIWFVVESLVFANSEMPFLKARQMLSFPCGVCLAHYNKEIEQYLTKGKSVLICCGGGLMCVIFMLLTQLNSVKQMPILLSNVMALLTCFPMAIGVLSIGCSFGRIFENRMLIALGTISYELYLVHAFMLNVLSKTYLHLFLFVILTLALAWLTHFIIGLLKSR